jgi:hypothetical protein
MVHTSFPTDHCPVIENREQLRVELRHLYDELIGKGSVDAGDLASALPAELRALWRRHPGPLVGVRTGEAFGRSVLDIDGPKHPEADVWLAAHRAQLPETRIHRTRSGGLHFVFQLHANGTAWAGMPGKPQLEDGRLKLDSSGKALYTAIVVWKDKALPNRFSAAVVDLVRANHPGDLQG